MLTIKKLFEGMFSHHAHMYGRNMLPNDMKSSMNKSNKKFNINKRYKFMINPKQQRQLAPAGTTYGI